MLIMNIYPFVNHDNETNLINTFYSNIINNSFHVKKCVKTKWSFFCYSQYNPGMGKLQTAVLNVKNFFQIKQIHHYFEKLCISFSFVQINVCGPCSTLITKNKTVPKCYNISTVVAKLQKFTQHSKTIFTKEKICQHLSLICK